MTILPQLKGRKRSLVFFIVGLIVTIINGFFFFVTRDMLSLLIEIVLLGFTLWYGYKAFGGED